MLKENPKYSSEEKELVKKFTEVLQVLKKNGVSMDIDSTELVSEEPALRIFNKITHSNRKLSELTDRYIMVDWFKDLGYKNPLDMAIKCWNDPVEMRSYELSPGAGIISLHLAKSSVDLHRITARPGKKDIVDATVDCYKQWPWIKPDLIHMQSGNMISSKYKYETVPIYSGFHFDDATEEAETLAEMGIVTVLFPQPWNNGYKPENSNLLTLDNARSNGLLNLGISRVNFNRQPKMVQAYFVLADHIIGK